MARHNLVQFSFCMHYLHSAYVDWSPVLKNQMPEGGGLQKEEVPVLGYVYP